MSIKYECYFCHEVFPVENRIDGLQHGYRVGFLCPHCGKNIKDNFLLSKQSLDDCQKKWLNRVVWLFVPFFIATFFDADFRFYGNEISLSALLLTVCIIGTGLILLLVPCTRKSGVFITEPVDEA